MTWQLHGNTQRWVGDSMPEPPDYELAWYRRDFRAECADCGIPKPTSQEHPRCQPCGQQHRQRERTKP